ncbi:MAG: GNAT family N-acetyltransferase [Chloroflexi bacterium]|nr:GNAT family N-acetyltransferase [Chloroflexota bacterium]MCY4247607.1 GNAT family N-acetyltransferase [Chloroflexota bacterium]
MEKTILRCPALCMRPLAEQDIAAILKYASAPEIAANTFVPHPYPPEAAHEFVQKASEAWRSEQDYTFAIIEAQSDSFAGVMGIHPVQEHQRAEVGYWIGLPFWGRGLATQALRLLIRFGFEKLGLNRIAAGHFAGNSASGRVMQKAGMRCEGTRRAYHYHRDSFKDSVWYAILRDEYEADRTH